MKLGLDLGGSYGSVATAMYIPEEHKTRYRSLLSSIEKTKADGVDVLIVEEPRVLGTSYDDIITNLGLISENKLLLAISPPR